MRVCLVGEYRPPLDEGMRNVAHHISTELKKHHEVLTLGLDGLFSTAFWHQAKDFQPQIIHYVPGPSMISLAIARALKSYCSGAKTVMSATQPRISRFSKNLIRFLKPDLVLTQSPQMESWFANSGCKTQFLPNGVDTERFVPVSPHAKRKLRDKYGLSQDKFVVLHIGSIRRRRNIGLLAERQQETGDRQVLVIGSTTTPVEQDIYESLTASGCIVWRTYFENIEELYALSDCYVFPAIAELSSIDLPLSVMEAMSCNLPVISTRYGALTRVFQESDGLYFMDDDGNNFMSLLEKVRGCGMETRTRESVLPYSWGWLAQRLGQIYSQVIA